MMESQKTLAMSIASVIAESLGLRGVRFDNPSVVVTVTDGDGGFAEVSQVGETARWVHKAEVDTRRLTQRLAILPPDADLVRALAPLIGEKEILLYWLCRAINAINEELIGQDPNLAPEFSALSEAIGRFGYDFARIKSMLDLGEPRADLKPRDIVLEVLRTVSGCPHCSACKEIMVELLDTLGARP